MLPVRHLFKGAIVRVEFLAKCRCQSGQGIRRHLRNPIGEASEVTASRLSEVARAFESRQICVQRHRVAYSAKAALVLDTISSRVTPGAISMSFRPAPTTSNTPRLVMMRWT